MNGGMSMIGVSAFAEKFGVKEETVRKWCREGKIRAEQDGKWKPWRIPEDEVPPIRNKRKQN